MAAQMTKSQLIEKIAGETEVVKKDVKGVLEALATVGYKELKKTGVFLVPGFAKFVVIKKAATKARQGTNPIQRRADDVQGQAGPENRQGPAGQGSQGRGLSVQGPFGGLLHFSGSARNNKAELGEGAHGCGRLAPVFTLHRFGPAGCPGRLRSGQHQLRQ
jgi:DNA-binding protein HU-beta